MAKRIVDEVLNYTIIINGDKGQKELLDLEKSTRKLRDANKDLRAEQARLAGQGQKNSQEYKNLTAEIKANNVAVEANEARMKELRNEIGITSLTMAQLTKKASELKIILRNLTPGSADFKRYQAELSQVNARMAELRAGANQTKFSMAKLGDQFNRYQALAFSVIAAVTGVVISFQKLIDYNGKLADAQADVAKTTNLSAEAVDELTASLGLLKTRTARIELLQLAEEAGRLGKSSKKDIMEFVQTANQIKVALGDDFQGDINENVRLIGKLTEQYQVGASTNASFGEGMTMIGSAINEVASSGSSQAGYLVDYISRLVGVSRQANISAQDQLGFAAVLDEAGQHVETSATATSQAIIGMYKDTETYAGIAGIEVSAFSKLLETDANEAFLRFLQGLNGNNAGLQQLTEKFDNLGIDGSRAISVLATMASQTEKIREKQDLANTSLNQATSLQEEYNKKNTNFAAVLDRINKRLGALIIDGRLVQWLKNAITWMAVLIGAIEDGASSANRWREILTFTAKAVAVFVTGLLSYKAAMQLVAFWTNKTTEATLLQKAAQKALLITQTAIKGATLLYAAAQALLTGNIVRATAAMRVFNTVTKLNPIGLVIGLAASAGAAYAMLNKNITEATVAQQTFNSVAVTAEENISREVAQIQKLLNTAKDENITREARLDAVRQLNAISPAYLANIKLEEIGHIDAMVAVQKYIQSLRDKAMEEASFEKRVELNKKLIDEQTKTVEAGVGLWDKIVAGSNVFYGYDYDQVIAARMQYAKETAVSTINEQIKALDQLDARLLKTAKQEVATFGFMGLPVPNSTGSTQPTGAAAFASSETPEEKKAREAKEANAKASAQRIAKETAAQYKALQQKVADLEREAELERMAADERELAQIRDKYAAIYLEAKGHKAEIAKLEVLEQEDLANAILAQKGRQFAAIKARTEAQEKEIQAIREKYGIVSNEEKLSIELLELQDHYAKELISYEEYLIGKKALEDKYFPPKENETAELKADQARAEAMENTARIMGNLGGAVNNLMQIEIARNAVVQKSGEGEEAFTKRKEVEEDKRLAIQKKYAKISMLISLGQIITDTAAAIMKVTAQMGVLALPMQIAYGILGATQAGIAIAQSSKIQGYEEGLYPVTDQHGRNFNAGVVHNAGTGKLNQPTILAGEKPEIIIDPATTRHLEMNYPEVINAIYSSAARVRGYESGNYPKSSAIQGSNTQTDPELKAMISALIQTQAKLEQTLNGGISAVYDDVQVRNIRTRLEVNNQVKTARKL